MVLQKHAIHNSVLLTVAALSTRGRNDPNATRQKAVADHHHRPNAAELWRLIPVEPKAITALRRLRKR